jgi:hypothetical protein
MTDRSITRPGYLLGGSGAPRQEQEPRRFIAGNDAPQTYTDRKLARFDDAPLDIVTIVEIQRMDCAGKSRDDIYRALAGRGVAMEQIIRVLNPEPAEGRQERANVGYANMKGRR